MNTELDIQLPCSVEDALRVVGRQLEAAGKVRKGSGTPYIAHLGNVVEMIRNHGGLRDTQVAGALHDVIEDLGWTTEMVQLLGGRKVAEMVAKVTENKLLSWQDRKDAVCEMAQKCCQGAGIIILADKIDNLSSTNLEMPLERQLFLDYWARFNAGWAEQKAFYRKLLRSLRGNKRLAAAKEYPELETDRAIEQLQKEYDRFEVNLREVKG